MTGKNVVTANYIGNCRVELNYVKTLNDKRGGIAHIITTNIAKFKTDFAAQSYANLVNATGEYYEVLEKDVV